jgi:hypothetical protein
MAVCAGGRVLAQIRDPWFRDHLSQIVLCGGTCSCLSWIRLVLHTGQPRPREGGASDYGRGGYQLESIKLAPLLPPMDSFV